MKARNSHVNVKLDQKMEWKYRQSHCTAAQPRELARIDPRHRDSDILSMILNC